MNPRIKASVLHIMNRGPDRVMIDEHEAWPTKLAKIQGHEPVVIFIRDDGWSLGASKELVHAAERIWRDKWAVVIIQGKKKPIRYQEWCLGREEFVEALS